MVVTATVLVLWGNAGASKCGLFPFNLCLDCEEVAVRSAAPRSPLQVGDRVLSIDGQAVAGPLTFYELQARLLPGQEHEVEVERGGATVRVPVTLQPFYPRFVLRTNLVIALMTLAILLLTLLHRPHERAVLPFVAFQGVIAVLVGTTHTCAFAPNLYFSLLFPLAAPLGWSLLLAVADDDHLRAKLRVPVRAIVAFGLAAGAFFVASVVGHYLGLPLLARHRGLLMAVDGWLKLLVGVVMLATVVAFFVLPLRWVRSLRARRRLQWLLWGVAAGASPYCFLYYLPAVLGLIRGGTAHALGVTLTVPFLVLIPLATAVAIVRYRWLDVEVVIDRSIAGAATLLAVVPALSLVAWRVGRWLFADAHTPAAYYLVVPMVTAAAYVPVEGRIKRVVAQWRGRFDYDLGQAVEGLTTALRSAVSREEVLETVSLHLRRLLAPEAVLMALRTNDAGTRHAHSTGVPASLVRWIESTAFERLVEECAPGGPGGSGVTLDGTPFALVCALRTPAGTDGLLLLGGKASEREYSTKDTQLLGIVADQLSMALRAFPAGGAAADAQAGEVARRLQELEREKDQIERLALTDPLTELANRRHLASALRTEVERTSRTGEPLALLLLDLDHFKKVNDTFGHAFGDRALRFLADTLRSSTRGGDTASRFGGEEFVVLLPRTGWDGAWQVAEKIRRAVEREGASLDGHQVGLTVSVGAAVLAGEDGPEAADRLIEEADRALYYGKNHGRNQSVLYADLPSRYKRP